MRIAIAYIGVVLVWSTTPLGVKWSNSSLEFLAAVSLRMLLALLLSTFILIFLRRPIFQSRGDWKAYLAGSLGVFPSMTLVYWSAQHIPSGLIAVVFGIYPFFVSVISRVFLGERNLTFSRVLALVLAVLGLGLIHYEQMQFGGTAMYGVLGVLLATLFFSISSVWLKAVGGGIDPLRQTAGVLLFAVPAFLILWFVTDGIIPTVFDFRSVTGVVYLAVAGSLLGGTLFFYVLKHCSAMVTSFVSLITPMLAILVGMVVEGEQLSIAAFTGCLIIVASLGIYQGIFLQLYNLLKKYSLALSDLLRRGTEIPSTKSLDKFE